MVLRYLAQILSGGGDASAMKILWFLSFGQMRRLPARWIPLLAVSLFLLHLPGQSAAQMVGVDPSEAQPSVTAAAFAPGEVLVGVHRDALLPSRKSGGIDGLRELAAFVGLSLAGSEVLEITDAANAPLFLRLPVAQGAEMATVARLQSAPEIAFAEPNWIVYAAGMQGDEMPTPILPSDPLFRSNQWGMQRIGASRAWAISQGAPIRVAVVDSGIDFNHPEFAGRLLAGKNYLIPGALPQDDSGHGTHVSGIIAATLNNGIGIAGLAPQVMIDPRKVLNSANGGTVANIAQAIRDAADGGAKIINLSITTDKASSVLEAAVNYAVGKGVLLVGAVGNSAPNPVWWPAAYPGVMAVAATDRADQRTYYSHTGAVDLAAPGGLSSQLIYSTWPAGIKCDTFTLTGYCTAFGTSMSAAYVSGAAALAWSVRPELSLVQIRNLLLESVTKTGAPTTDVGSGRLNAQAAVRQALLSDLQPSRREISALLPVGSAAYSETLTLRNPSGEVLFWKADVTGGKEWLALQTSSGAPGAGGSIRYSQPAQLTLVISPELLQPGNFNGTLQITGTRSNNSQIHLTIPVTLHVRSTLQNVYLSMLSRHSALGEWQMPDGNGKQNIQMTDSSSSGIPLPFSFSLESPPVTTIQLYSDGFLTFPAGATAPTLPVACTPDETPAQQAIYGWWGDLRPDLDGSVSTFTSDSGAFVIEFLDVPIAGAVSATDRVSFQMALFPNGVVKLNYAAVPASRMDVVVGVEVNEGLLSARIACRKGTTDMGTLPAAGERLTIQSSDLR